MDSIKYSDTLGLYIHIPFCKTICSYCDFPKLVSNKENQKKYIDFLINEIYNNMVWLKNIDTVYIGGGTPNSIELDLLEKLLKVIEPILRGSKENSIELNPELVTNDLCVLLHKYNINRASLGVQTLKDESIKLLNRHHNRDIVTNAFKLLRANGIDNISADLIFGIPGTNIDDVKNDLDFILNLKPTHLSYYSLILEDKTVFSYLYSHNKLELCDDDLEADMYEYINERLNNNGYKHYEISNYAKPGYESIHNLRYWSESEYLGFGLGAASFFRGRRFTRPYRMDKYYLGLMEEDIEISSEIAKNEFMMLGLRKVDGIKISDYRSLFNSTPFDDFKLDSLFRNKLIELDGDNIRICKDKLFIANLIFEEFIGD